MTTFRVQCQECAKIFQTAQEIPQCPRCNSVDIELLADSRWERREISDCPKCGHNLTQYS